ncbi:hypothetical protein BO94DRAFT_623786 [Aspergillus sclerotioniger CBS 115572]|uniref:N-acetyltransferase domain-containing protein n=1 Tax=Aspergillus sclerotioniger CBS 115572 TaxID=1450535 RepID=A0A317WU55_9EURO|nr:hypothetical protein BO94DRAFT_623786 [Aspergillus sclerotioniger CBS 115572]PWY88707.1 hypothetical protein BO94DRAFT_623786 [Aspergillus sclerotioniger CBS 115572]
MASIAPAISKLNIAPAPVVANSCLEVNNGKDLTSSDPKFQVVVKLPTQSTTTHNPPRRVIPRPPLPLYTPPRQRNNQRQNRGQTFLTRQRRALGCEYQSQRKVAHSFPTPLFSYASNELSEARPSTFAQSVDQTGSGSPAGKEPSQAASPNKQKHNMSSSDESDDIVLRDFRTKSKQRNVENALPHISESGDKDIPPGGNSHDPRDEPAAERKRVPTRAEIRAELEKLKKEELANFNKRQEETEVETADPAVLAKCRDGPGVDPDSKVYQDIAKRRRVRPVVETKPSSRPESSGEESPEDDNLEQLEELKANYDWEKLLPQWDAYRNDLVMYPNVINGEVTLASEPTEAQRELQAKFLLYDRHPHASQNVNKLPPFPESLEWQPDSHLCNWFYVPPEMYHVDKWKLKFRRFLDYTIVMSCYADNYHKSFWDGTAHPDGINTFFIPKLPDHTTILDPNDEQGLLHRSETAEGYCKNLAMHTKKEEEDEEQRLLRVRRANEAFLASREVNPNAPKVNIYLRPAEMRDVPQLLLIYNWYARESSFSIHTRDVTPDYIRERIQAAKAAQLPFIVAVERSNYRQREAIFGYATASEYISGPDTAGKFTAQLEVFVLPQQQRKGVGYCLLDKLLQICDPMYMSKEGYTFDNRGMGGYSLGGQRVLARLIFCVSIKPEDRAVYRWTRDWLEKYGFELQGQLKGAACKFERLLDVYYFVRNTTFVLNYR